MMRSRLKTGPLTTDAMQSHSINVLGLELSFKLDVDPVRIGRASALLDERYAKLARHGGALSKEKLLAFLALSLADDVLLLQDEKAVADEKMRELLGTLKKAAG